MVSKKLRLLAAAASVVVFAGCTSVVSPDVSEAEFLVPSPKVAGSADLYVTEAFQTHNETKMDFMDFTKWQFDLGPLAVDSFKFALGSHFEKVNVKQGSPAFPLGAGSNGSLAVAVEPEFSDFSSSCPYLFKFENYVVRVSFRVKACDQSGKVLVDKVYDGVGKKRGAVGTASAGIAANPVAAQLAVKNAVDQAVADIIAAVKR